MAEVIKVDFQKRERIDELMPIELAVAKIAVAAAVQDYESVVDNPSVSNEERANRFKTAERERQILEDHQWSA